ncbi:proton-conducting transporter transmembrane domain-containing protein [Actinomycetospora sp. CA-053990]|uniref:proton-conducting transporter transmembrane domain-containing protein n=1 Tax=Actinomycetospora sp. CA-053990 TaxID=3239891 RepID=UPI003D8C5D1D
MGTWRGRIADGCPERILGQPPRPSRRSRRASVHYWLPTVYASTQPTIAAILSGAVANIGTYGLLRFGAGILGAELRFAAGRDRAGGRLAHLRRAAVSRGDAQEMLAYSSIEQIGSVLVALGVGGPSGWPHDGGAPPLEGRGRSGPPGCQVSSSNAQRTMRSGSASRAFAVATAAAVSARTGGPALTGRMRS